MPSLVKIEFVRSDEELFGMFPMYFFYCFVITGISHWTRTYLNKSHPGILCAKCLLSPRDVAHFELDSF